MFRTFVQAMAYLGRFTDYEQRRPAGPAARSYNLDRTRAILAALGNPERAFRSVHIAGTKGKGSTALMLESVLRTAGLRTGLYTSPHLVHLLERIQIDGEPIEEGDFLHAMNVLRSVMDRVRPTFFEIMTAAAFLLFRRAGVDTAVIEVGLGGRLDATNVITPVLSIITTIDYDHTETLGRTLAKIAREKAGILKPGVPAITSERKREPLTAIRTVARRLGSPLLELGRRIRIKSTPPVVRFEMEVDGARVRLPAPGAHQAENAALVVAAARKLGIARRAIERGIARARLPGRIEVVRRRPEVIVDVAHNPVAIRALRDTVGRARGRCWLVFGASGDKDVGAMLRTLRPIVDVAFVTRARSPRACPPERLAEAAPFPSVTIGSVARAVALALKRAAPRDRVLVTGSFYVVGEAIEALRQHERRQH